ncbi:MAG: hypothetical protein ACXAC5_05120 [Promethearchaeota archaeon]|jgi:hypothetical protein
MEPFIKTVTVTGADDSIKPLEMLEITERFPFVEWGILLSLSSQGNTRFPSRKWLTDLFNIYDTRMKLSGHICGRWVRDLCKGKLTWLESSDNDSMWPFFMLFNRIQLNFHSEVHKINHMPFIRGLAQMEGMWMDAMCDTSIKPQFIFQLDNVNDSILGVARDVGVDAAGLFDLSGGLGILPEQWPEASSWQGFAGGLSPENLKTQLELIAPKCSRSIWIDAETHLRSSNDRQFDLAKVVRFLEIAQPFVIDL